MSSPLAHWITFATYANWLHGDERGSIQRYGAGGERSRRLAARPALRAFEESELSQPPYLLDEPRRQVVLLALREVAEHRGWRLLAVHVRTTHLHIVVAAEAPPERVMNDFKAYASRRLNEAGLDPPGRKRWVRHGSTRYLWTEEEVAARARYTLEEQGEPMAIFAALEDLPGPSQARP